MKTICDHPKDMLADQECRGEMTDLQVEAVDELISVKQDAVNMFDQWNDVTSAIPNGTSWYYEAKAVVESIAAMAFGAGIFYQADRENLKAGK